MSEQRRGLLLRRVLHDHDDILLPVLTAFLSTERGVLRTSDKEGKLFLNGPWLLSQICHSWRQIVITTSKFWSDIRVGGPDYMPEPQSLILIDNFSHCQYLLSLQISRSKERPLSVRMEGNMAWGFSSSETDALWTMLFPHRKRWGKLAIIDDINRVYPSLRRVAHTHHALPLRCPNLTRLRIDVSPEHWMEDTTPMPLFQCNHSLPNLKKISFISMMPPIDIWASLTELKLVNMFHLEHFMVDAVGKLACLETFKVIDCTWFTSPKKDAFHLPRLTTLHALSLMHEDVGDGEEENDAPLLMFSWVKAPRLEDIAMDGLFDNQIPALLSFVQAQQSSLHSFRCNLYTPIQRVLPALGYMKPLRQLALELTEYDPGMDSATDCRTLVQAICKMDQKGSFECLPHLRKLSVLTRLPLSKQQLLLVLDALEHRAPKSCTDRGMGQFGLPVVSLWSAVGWKDPAAIVMEVQERVDALWERGMVVSLRNAERIWSP